MTSVAELVGEFADRSTALSTREHVFLTRINQICIWLAKEKMTEVKARCMQELEMDEKEAVEWIHKAEDFMAMGIISDMNYARQMYHMRLQHIFAICMANYKRDMVEITRKPVRVIGDGGKRTVIDATHTKVKAQAIDSNLIQLALKAAEKAATIMGVKTGAGSTIHNQTNIQINNNDLIGAQELQDQTAETLARIAGFENIVAVLPGDTLVDLPSSDGDDEDLSGEQATQAGAQGGPADVPSTQVARSAVDSQGGQPEPIPEPIPEG